MSEAESVPEEKYVRLQDRPIDEVVTVLHDVLGKGLVAYAMRGGDKRVMDVYAEGYAEPDERTETELRQLAEVTDGLLELEQGSEPVVRAMMFGIHPMFGDKSVIGMFHDGEGEKVLPVVVEI